MAADQLSKLPVDGTKLGQSATDLVGFYGATPVAQAATFASIGPTATTAILKARINSIRTALRAFGFVA